MIPDYGSTNCYCDDGCLAVAIMRVSSQGHNLYLLSEVLGMGEGAYENQAGIHNADTSSISNSLDGVAIIRMVKGSESCEIEIRREKDSLLPKVDIK